MLRPNFMFKDFFDSRAPVLLLFVLLYALFSLHTMQRFLLSSNFGDTNSRVTLSAMVNGYAHRPFVYRALVPKMIDLVVKSTPTDTRTAINTTLQQNFYANLLGARPALRATLAENGILYMRAVMASIIYLCLWGYIFLLYKLGALFFPKQWAMALFMPIVGLVMITAFADRGLFIYDFPVLFLCAACYYCLARQRWGWYFFWFILACFNKETTIFLFAFYTFWYFSRLDAKPFITYWTLQWIIFVVIRLFIVITFMNNPGFFLEDHMNWQISALFAGYNFKELSIYFVIIFLLTYHWRTKPLFARYVLTIFPLAYISYFVYGVPGEYRVFYDLFPLLTVLICDTLVRGTGVAKSAIFHRPAYAHARVV